MESCLSIIIKIKKKKSLFKSTHEKKRVALQTQKQTVISPLIFRGVRETKIKISFVSASTQCVSTS